MLDEMRLYVIYDPWPFVIDVAAETACFCRPLTASGFSTGPVTMAPNCSGITTPASVTPNI